MRPIGLRALSGAVEVTDSVVVVEPERRITPLPTPPLPAQAPGVPRPHQMAPYPLLDPIPHVGKAPARVSHPELVDPATQDRVDHLDHSSDGLGTVASEHLIELPQRRPLTALELWLSHRNTKLVSLSQGVDFLGYRLISGRGIPTCTSVRRRWSAIGRRSGGSLAGRWARACGRWCLDWTAICAAGRSTSRGGNWPGCSSGSIAGPRGVSPHM